MKKCILFLTFGLLFLLSCPSPGPDVFACEIEGPEEGILQKEKSFIIHWNLYQSKGHSKKPLKMDYTLDLELMKDGESFLLLGENIFNTGYFLWQNIAELPSEDHYTLRLSIPDPFTGIKVYFESNPFRIDNEKWKKLDGLGEDEECMIAGIVFGPNEELFATYRHIDPKDQSINGDKDRILRVKEWDGDNWISYDTNTPNLLYCYSFCSSPLGEPALFYVGKINSSTDYASYNQGNWNEEVVVAEISDVDDSNDNVQISKFDGTAGFSSVTGKSGLPVFAFYKYNGFVEIEGLRIEDYDLDIEVVIKKKNPDGTWSGFINNEGDVIKVITNSSEMVDYSISDHINKKPLNFPFNTSLVLSSQGVPYVSFQENLSEDNNSIYVYTLIDDVWEPLGGGPVSTGSVTSPSLAIDDEDRLLILFSHSSMNNLMVKRFNGTAWEDLFYPLDGFGEALNVSYEKGDVTDGYPTITLAGGCPVVASSGGVRIFVKGAWKSLGFPNHFAGKSMGRGAWWAAGTDESIAVIFPNRNENYKIEVWTLDLQGVL